MKITRSFDDKFQLCPKCTNDEYDGENITPTGKTRVINEYGCKYYDVFYKCNECGLEFFERYEYKESMYDDGEV